MSKKPNKPRKYVCPTTVGVRLDTEVRISRLRDEWRTLDTATEQEAHAIVEALLCKTLRTIGAAWILWNPNSKSAQRMVLQTRGLIKHIGRYLDSIEFVDDIHKETWTTLYKSLRECVRSMTRPELVNAPIEVSYVSDNKNAGTICGEQEVGATGGEHVPCGPGLDSANPSVETNEEFDTTGSMYSLPESGTS